MPLDLIPGFVMRLGLIDDGALQGWIRPSLKNDIDHFIELEKDNTTAGEYRFDGQDSSKPPE